MRRFRFRSALTDHGWHDSVEILVDDTGRIVTIDDATGGPVDCDFGNLTALPAMVNLHSHAFQRGFAGLTEYRICEKDSFWTWRSEMFRFLDRLSPEDAYTIARHLYLEMMLAGYGWVGEFHYLHHDIGGARYEGMSAMSDAVIHAAADAGIGICWLPVLYQRGGFDDRPLVSGQIRFHLEFEEFHRLYEKVNSPGHGKNFCSGIALHSLRAVSVREGRNLVDSFAAKGSRIPIHIHIAEQAAEVEQCLALHHQRPVEFLFDHFDIDENWCLIHSTHLNARELALIANSGAVAGLCPTTEASLGDGFFPMEQFVAQGGRWGIGTDSQISIDAAEELRTIEYNVRLRTGSRSVLSDNKYSNGRFLYESAARFGADALGINTGTIAVGKRADWVLVNADSARIAKASADRLVDRLVFCSSPDLVGNHRAIAGVVIAGDCHVFEAEPFRQKYLESLRSFTSLNARLLQIGN